MKQTNGNHFGFDGMCINEQAQYTEYPEGGFYDWHVDNDVNFNHEPPVRKISMTCLLSPESEFEGGDLELMKEGKVAKIDYQPPMDPRDFYIFPYDMRHCVYPFNGTNETRRTLAANCDVQFDPIKNRGAV